MNLIGEHTDYNDGFVLPFALPHRTASAASPAERPEWTVSLGGRDRARHVRTDDLAPGAVHGWAGYVAGVVWALREAGVDVPDARLAIASDVPIGAGLSSSAALECSVLAALRRSRWRDPTECRPTWPALAQRAENELRRRPRAASWTSPRRPSAVAGHALFLDCRAQAVEQVPFDLESAGLAMLIVDTHAPHRHADNEYAARRSHLRGGGTSCSASRLARRRRDLPSALAALPDDLMRRRVRHVVTENERVLATVALLRSETATEIGPLLTASHASLRDDYEVTVPELDVAVMPRSAPARSAPG